MSPASGNALRLEGRWIHSLLHNGWRFGLTVGGPIAVAGANLLAALILIPFVSPAAFGAYSFGMVLLQVGTGISDGLLGAPLAVCAGQVKQGEAGSRLHFHKVNLLLAGAAALVVMAILAAIHEPIAGAVFALYAGISLLRWYGRANAFIDGKLLRVGVSDFVYSLVLLTLVSLLFLSESVTLLKVSWCLVGAAAAGFLGLGRRYAVSQSIAGWQGRLADFAPVFKEKAGWSVAGIVVNAATIEAHVFVATLLGGPASFAPIALAALAFRPTLITVYALAQRERPMVAQLLGKEHRGEARRLVRSIQMVSMMVWAVNVALALVVCVFYLEAYLPSGYDLVTVQYSVAAFALVMAIRSLRMPWAVFIQADNRFKSLAKVTAITAPVSLGLAGVGFWTYGAVGCVGGMLLADILLTAMVRRLFLSDGQQ